MQRRADDVLVWIGSLRDELRNPVSGKQVTAWWDWVERIEGHIASDTRASDYERQLVSWLKEGVSDAIRDVQAGRVFDTARICAALTGLQNSVERRTIGTDGSPLRR